jgi:starch synthase (maltosyl-transferring)
VSDVYLDLAGLGLRSDAVIDVHDELGGADWTWGSHAFVRLTPANPAHILHVRNVRS